MSDLALEAAAARRRLVATAIGFVAVLLWAVLAVLTAASGKVPPFQLSAICFAIGTLVGIVVEAVKPVAERRRALAQVLGQPPAALALGIAGLFGYHFLYFTALRHAPAIEASLIAYLWPLLIVVMSALLPGERLRAHQMAGAVLGLAGAALLIVGKPGASVAFRSEHAFGHAMAGLCALTWSTYSVLSRRFSAVPTATVTVYCLATAVLSAICHVALETTVWPAGSGEWVAVFLLGLGPVGLAFYVWDHGVKHGDIQVLGAASYASPVLSSLVLIAAGFADATWQVAVACVLITGGAVLAAKDMFLKRRAAS